MRAQIEDPHEHLTKLEAMRMLREKDAALTAALREKDAAVREKDTAVRGKDAAVREKDTAVRGKDAAVREKDAAVREKDAALTAAVREKNAAVREKDTALREKDTAVREKDTAVREKDAAVREKDAAVREKDAAVREKDTEIGDLHTQVQVSYPHYYEVKLFSACRNACCKSFCCLISGMLVTNYLNQVSTCMHESANFWLFHELNDHPLLCCIIICCRPHRLGFNSCACKLRLSGKRLRSTD